MTVEKKPNATGNQVAKTTEKPTAAAKGAMEVSQKNAQRPECQIITRLAAKGEDSLRAVILQLTGGDELFVDKFVQCCKAQVNKHWKRLVGKDGKPVWTNPFLVIPINSQLEALYKCASKKVLPDGYNCNLIPYLGRDDKRVDVSIDYKGLIDTAIKENIILDCDAQPVCENDDFEWSLGEVTRWSFDPRKSRGAVCGYCAWAILPSGRKKWSWMSNEDIAQVRACARTQMIWNKWEGEMSKKTVIRRMFKTLPNTPKLQNLIEIDNDNFVEMEAGEDGRFVHRGMARKTPVRKVIGAPVAQLPETSAEAVEAAPDAAGEEVQEPELAPVEAEHQEEAAAHQSGDLFQ